MINKPVTRETDSNQLWIPHSTAQGDFDILQQDWPAFHYRYGSSFDGVTGALSATPNSDGAVLSNTAAGGSATITANISDTHNGSCVMTNSATGWTAVAFAAAGKTARMPTNSRSLLDTLVAITTLSDGSNTFRTYAGNFTPAPTGAGDGLASITDGAWFDVDSNTDVHWICRVRSTASGHTTSVTTGITVVAGQEYHLQIFKIMALGTIIFVIDNVVVATISADVPTTVSTNTAIGFKRSAGATARTVTAFWAFFDYYFKRAA